MIRRHTFNLIEILMAMGVLMIGVVSLIGLFPMASKVTSDAAMETTVPNTLEEFSAALRDLTAHSGGWKEWIGLDGAAGSALIPDEEPDGMLGFKSEDSYLAEIIDVTKWQKVGGKSFPNLYKHQNKAGVFMLISIRGENIVNYDMATDIDGEKIESRVLLQVWQSKIFRRFKKNVDLTPYADTKYGVRINMKVGWPAERPEAEKTGTGGNEAWVSLRKIKVTSFDLLNPHPETVE